MLEDRTTPAVITVTGTGDSVAVDGLATLREAITSINNQVDVNADVTLNRVGNYASLPGGTPDVIDFNVAGGGVHTIAVIGTVLPTITKPLAINGYSQSGASANTLAGADNAIILIQLSGLIAPVGASGLTLGSGSGGSTIRGWTSPTSPATASSCRATATPSSATSSASIRPARPGHPTAPSPAAATASRS